MPNLSLVPTLGLFLATTTCALASTLPASPRHTAVTTAQVPIVKIVHSFSYSQGGIPSGELTLAADGNLYGVNSEYGPLGDGTIFRVSPGGAVGVVASVPRSIGSGVLGGLTLGPDKLLYDVTTGTYSNGGGGGTIFKMTPQGAFTALYTFNTNSLLYPRKVTFGPGGVLYGVTGNSSSVTGTAYKLTTSGAQFLTTFTDQMRGTQPNPLTLGPDGNFYGTAFSQGLSHTLVYGSAFRLTPAGQRTTLAQFVPNDSIRQAPSGQLALGPDGAFYGVTYSNTLYRLTASGSRTLVADLNKSFASIQDCFTAGGRLAVGSDGALYGASGRCLFRSTLAGAVTLLGVAPGSADKTRLNMPTFGADGNLYGSGNDYPNSNGFVYEVVLH